jgi:hypothetical protein
MNCAVCADPIPPISTARWYDAPPPGAFGRLGALQVETDDRVRSQVSGVALCTVCPALMRTTMSLGSDWQSVDRHQVSLPLVTVYFCVVVPTFIVQSLAP